MVYYDVDYFNTGFVRVISMHVLKLLAAAKVVDTSGCTAQQRNSVGS